MPEDPIYHIQVGQKDIGNYVILPGDRGRVERIAKYLDQVRPVASNREYYTMTGYLQGEKVSVMSTGMGAPCITIAVEELRTLGVHTYIRIGTAGGLQPALTRLGDGVIATGAIRDDGTTARYIPESYPAIAHPDVVEALRQAAKTKHERVHHGIVLSTDAYYARNFNIEETRQLLDLFIRGNALCVEMEVSGLFVLGSLFGLRCGAILTVREETNDKGEYTHQAGDIFEKGLERSIQTTIEAIRILIETDKRSELS